MNTPTTEQHFKIELWVNILTLTSELYLFGGGIWKIPQSPEAVLDQTLAGVRQVKPQGLHASYTHGQNS